jgi:sortase A
MTPTTEQKSLVPTRTEWVLRSSRWLLVGVGVIALSYFAFAKLDAWVYQASANRSLDSQIQMQREQISPPQPAAKDGDVLGRVDIPRLGMSVAVLKGTSSRILRLGAGHIEGTALLGGPGNSGIAGHRDTFFRPLRNIRQNDEIEIQTATGLSRYRVDWFRVVGPGDMSVLARSTESELTLVTCYPFYYFGAAPKRFVVHAQKL